MGKEVPCYGCEKRHVEHGYNCHSDCPEYKEYHDNRTAKLEFLTKKRSEEAMVVNTRLRAINKNKRGKKIQSAWKG